MKKRIFYTVIILLFFGIVILRSQLAYTSISTVPLGMQVKELYGGVLEVEHYDWRGKSINQFSVLKDDIERSLVKKSIVLSNKIKQVFASMVVIVVGALLLLIIRIGSRKLKLLNNSHNQSSKLHVVIPFLLFVACVAVLTQEILQYRDLIIESERVLTLLEGNRV